MTLLPRRVLGFLPARGGEWGTGTPDAFRKGGGAHMHHCVRAGQVRQRFSPTPHTHSPGPTISSTMPTADQHAPPHPREHHHRLTTTNAARPARPKRSHRGQGPAVPQPRGRGQPPPAQAVADQTQNRSTPGQLPSRAQIGPAKLPPSRYSRRNMVAAASSPVAHQLSRRQPSGVQAGPARGDPPEMVEALDVIRAFYLAPDEHFFDVIFASDCLPLVQQLNSSVHDRSSIGSVVADINYATSVFYSVIFKHVRRHLSVAAHLLAKSCMNFVGLRLFVILSK